MSVVDGSVLFCFVCFPVIWLPVAMHRGAGRGIRGGERGQPQFVLLSMEWERRETRMDPEKYSQGLDMVNTRRSKISRWI